MARKSKYETHILPNIDKIKEWRESGSSINDIVKALKISKTLFYNAIDANPELKELLDDATDNMKIMITDIAETSLADKLKDRMLTVEIVKDGDGMVKSEKKKLVLADTTAIIFALKAGNPEKWDPLGVRRIEEQKESESLSEDILNTLNKYKEVDLDEVSKTDDGVQ